MPKRNGFCMFMESRRASVVESGVVLTRGRAQLAEIVSDEWAVMPQEEKDKFIKMAERFNERQAKYKKQTTPSAVYFQPQIRTNQPQTDVATRTYLDQVAANRELVLELFKTDAWKTQPIVVCSFIPYFDPSDGQVYFPAEIGLSTFTLQDGVVDNFGRIINTGEPPLGYGVEVTSFVKTLGIPHPIFESEFSKIDSLMLILDSYLEKYRGGFGTDNFYVFALDSEMQMVSGCLDWLNKKTEFKCPVRVLSLPLFAHLASTHDQGKGKGIMMTWPQGEENPCYAAISGYRTAGRALNEVFCYPSAYPLTKVGMYMNANEVDQILSSTDNYKYYDELCCVYHFKNGEGIQYCCLNAANRYAYNILEILTLSNEVKIIPGGHYPVLCDRQKEIERRHGWLAKWGITTVESNMEMGYAPEPLATSTRNSRRTKQFAVPDETNRGGEALSTLETAQSNEGAATGQSYERPTEILYQDRDVEVFAPRRNANPFRGTAPMVFQSRGTGSAETKGPQDGN